MQYFVCPYCKRNLINKDCDWHCNKCNKNYFDVFGILDFRGIYKNSDELLSDDRKLATLIENYNSLNYEKLLDVERSFNKKWLESLPRSVKKSYIEYDVTLEKRVNERCERIKNSLREVNAVLSYENALDVGCGKGAMLIHLSRYFDNVYGIEPDLSKLVLAKKLLEENNIQNVKLICCSGETLPFKDGFFDFVNALNVIEHLKDQRQSIVEVRRVMRTGGYFCFDSRNRFDLFRPEPHVNLYFVGFIPRRFMHSYVYFRNKMDYEGIKLLSYFELKKYISIFSDYYILLPTLELSKTYKKIYEFIKNLPLISQTLKLFFPTYQVVVKK